MSRILALIITIATLTPMAPVAAAAPPPSGCPVLDLTRLRAPSVWRHGLTDDQLASDFLGSHGLAEHGYRPTRLAGVRNGDRIEYATRWVQTPGPDFKVAPGLTGAQFHADYLANRSLYRPTDVSGFNTADGVRYNIVWERNTSGVDWLVHRDKTIDEMTDLINDHKQDGYAPERIEGYRFGDGTLRFVSTWIRAPRCDWQLHPVMTIAQSQSVFDDLTEDGYRQQQIDATSWQNDMWYHGIWWRQPGPGFVARVNHDWYRFQRLDNNYWCDGFVTTNFYTADNGTGVRHGGIWTFNTWLTIDDGSPLADQVREEVDCAPGRGGSAIFDLNSGEQILVHGDDLYGMSSTGKALILWVLLDKLEEQNISLMTLLDLPEQLGSNQKPNEDDPDPLTAGHEETIEYLARIMIDYSNNWATNRLIQYIAEISEEEYAPAEVMTPINEALESLGMRQTRFNRYMTGTGSPTIHGPNPLCDEACADYANGYDNVTTPREFAYFLQLMHVNPGLLEPAGHAKFWKLMGLNRNTHDDALDEGLPDWSGELHQFTKGGSNKWGWNGRTNPWTPLTTPGDFAHRPQLGPHVQRSEAGRIEFNNGQVVVYATFFNDAENVPTYQPFKDALDCIQVDVARAYSGTTTGTVLPQCK